MLRLPTALGREPLIDALFEVRFRDTSVPLADILTGYLLSKIDHKASVVRLPPAEIPATLRAADPGLRYAPSQRLDWGDYFISLGDYNIVVSCKLPYQKWPAFKRAILQTIDHVSAFSLPGQVDRYSLKYVNLLRHPSITEQAARLDMSITLGKSIVRGEPLSLQVHQTDGDTVHILTIVIGAQAQILDGPLQHGAVVDVDSIRNVAPVSFNDLGKTLSAELENLRHKNKIKFFSLLTDAAIEEMEPKYD